MQAEKAKQSKAVSCEALQHLLVSYSRRCLFVLKTFKYLKKQCFIPTKLQGFVYAKNVSNFLPLSEILLQFCRIYIQLHRKIVGIFSNNFHSKFLYGETFENYLVETRPMDCTWRHHAASQTAGRQNRGSALCKYMQKLWQWRYSAYFQAIIKSWFFVTLKLNAR